MLQEKKGTKKLCQELTLELVRVPDPARRPGPEENEPKTRFYSGPNLSQARELYS